MDGAMTFNWLDTRRGVAVQARGVQKATVAWLERENARLMEENERLRRQSADLSASAELWIRLYEAALERLNATER